MFSFLKKCIQIEEPKGVRERALKIFSGIEGFSIDFANWTKIELPSVANC